MVIIINDKNLPPAIFESGVDLSLSANDAATQGSYLSGREDKDVGGQLTQAVSNELCESIGSCDGDFHHVELCMLSFST